MDNPETIDALIIGAGPAGLMAAEVLSAAGRSVLVADAMPSPARKFLMAGKSGLNLTKDENFDRFLRAYGPAAARMEPILRAFGPDAVREWATQLGQALFVGSSGLVFPVAMKASPLLRAWLERLDGNGVVLRRKWRWTGWEDENALFDTPDGVRRVQAKTTVLALGGASWRRLGSDGAWAKTLRETGCGINEFAPSNAGIKVAWSPFMDQHLGQAIKGARLTAGGITSRGEFVIAKGGLEGGGVYPLTPALRDGHEMRIDFKPDLSLDQLQTRLAAMPGKVKARDALRRLGLGTAAIALIQEWGRPLPKISNLGAVIKGLKAPDTGLRPMDEAISTAGGLSWDTLDDDLMLRPRPGVFAAGEMLDWEAPTGGYLLTGCFATGHWAGSAALRYLAR